MASSSNDAGTKRCSDTHTRVNQRGSVLFLHCAKYFSGNKPSRPQCCTVNAHFIRVGQRDERKSRRPGKLGAAVARLISFTLCLAGRARGRSGDGFHRPAWRDSEWRERSLVDCLVQGKNLSWPLLEL